MKYQPQASMCTDRKMDANVLSRARGAVSSVFSEAAFETRYSHPVSARVASGSNTANDSCNADLQCRIAMTVRKPVPAVTLAVDDADTKLLLDSGRWTELLIPVGAGD